MAESQDRSDLLIVDANPAREAHYRALLGDVASRIEVVGTDADLARIGRERAFAALVLALDGAPGAERLDAASVLAKLAGAAAQPVIVVAAEPPDIAAVAQGRAGLVDYLPTALVPALLRAKVDMLLTLNTANATIGALARRSEELTAALAAEREAAAALRDALGEEVHRSKNVLAIIQSIALRTLGDGRPVPEARTALAGRLRALARAYHMTAAAGRKGTLIADIIEAELEDALDRVAAHGPEVRIAGSVVQTLALAVHELKTNAARHGALSAPEGSASVDWALLEEGSDRHLEIAWKEQGGPPCAPPPRYGFGLALVASMAGRAAETPRIRFEPQGFSCSLRLPGDVIVAPAGGLRR